VSEKPFVVLPRSYTSQRCGICGTKKNVISSELLAAQSVTGTLQSSFAAAAVAADSDDDENEDEDDDVLLLA